MFTNIKQLRGTGIDTGISQGFGQDIKMLFTLISEE